MENGTAIGLLVGSAVLLLAVSPRRPGTVLPNGQLAPATGGVFNPWNLIQRGSGNPFAAQPPLFPIPQPGSTPAYGAQNPGYQNIGYSPSPGQGGTPNAAWSPGGYGTGNYQGGAGTGYAQGGGIGTPAQFQYPVMTPAGGFQSLAYMSPAPGGGMSANNATYGTPAQSYAA